MVQRGKSLDFMPEEIEDLADMRLGDNRIFPLLAMLFPILGSHDGSDIDHVFPRSQFTPTRLTAAGVDESQIEQFRDGCDRIANLQLLDRAINNEKRAILPADWLDRHCSTEEAKQNYCDRHVLGDVPRKVPEFLEFYASRRDKLRERIALLVNAV